MLIPFGPDIWIAEGPAVEGAMGFSFPTRMAAIRLSGGGLLAWSPIPLTDALAGELAALGEVTQIIGPNHLHHLSLADWVEAFPAARLLGTEALVFKREDLAFDGVLGEAPDPAWARDIDQVLLRGNRVTDEAIFFHRPSGTVLFTDLVQQFGKDWFTGWRGVVAKLDYKTGPEPAVPRLYRIGFNDRKAARASLARVLDWPAERVLMAHGTPVEADAQGFLQRAFAFL
ncbi:DUF4336 domain-containing protein [Rhodovulum sp. DZ06]|uniref:DUF4336 domain-containing protein n=1 Tax=Rhodovulum sp. DZ06 TaxID=3425126 RepID=UPI003D327E1A